MTERRADDATRDAVQWLKCEFMSHRLGEEFDARVSTVTDFGIFVELKEVFVDGLVSDDPQLMELVLQQADFTTRPRALVETPVERLDQQHEIQAHARVPLESLTLASLRCEERTRRLEELDRDAWHEWTDRSDELQDLVGARIITMKGDEVIEKFVEKNAKELKIKED